MRVRWLHSHSTSCVTTTYLHTLKPQHTYTPNTTWLLPTQHNSCDKSTTTMMWLQSSMKLVREEPCSCWPTSITCPYIPSWREFPLFDYLSTISNKTLRVIRVFHWLSIIASSHTGLEPHCWVNKALAFYHTVKVTIYTQDYVIG